jgi:hypothetical protein
MDILTSLQVNQRRRVGPCAAAAVAVQQAPDENQPPLWRAQEAQKMHVRCSYFLHMYRLIVATDVALGSMLRVHCCMGDCQMSQIFVGQAWQHPVSMSGCAVKCYAATMPRYALRRLTAVAADWRAWPRVVMSMATRAIVPLAWCPRRNSHIQT